MRMGHFALVCALDSANIQQALRIMSAALRINEHFYNAANGVKQKENLV